MIDINPEEVLTWNTTKLWYMFNIIKQNTEIDQDIMEKVKNGINIKIPIWYITEEWYEIYPSTKKVAIKGHGKYELNHFMNEVEERDRIMKETIIENIDPGEIISPR